MNEILKAIVNSIPGCWYLRATDQDANITVDDLDLSVKIICIYNNLPSVPNVASQGRFVYREWPVEIKILSLSDFDATTEEADQIREALLPIADAIFDKLPDFDNVPPVDGYGVDFVSEVKIYDKILTGLNLSFTFNVPRTVYNEC